MRIITVKSSDHENSMNQRSVFNFSAGPAVLPTEVLERAKEELLSFSGTGMSVMEFSHRSKQFAPVLEKAEQGIRNLMHLPDAYKVLFLQGGATIQFSMAPMNFLQPGSSADYVITGEWGRKAVAEAGRFGEVKVIYSSEAEGFTRGPAQEEIRFSPDAAYIHYTSNETIDGVEFKYDLDGGPVPVISDASSNILSKPFDIEKYALIYAGAQKNIGPSGVTVVIIREDMLERVPENLVPMLDYRKIADNHSMLNTPNTWGIYLTGLVCDWLEEQGGVEAMAVRNREKAEMLYHAIDSSDGFYRGRVMRESRSFMNVTFYLPSKELDEKFCAEAEAKGMYGLKGHRSVGGVRASIYNAFPKKGVEALVEFMSDFSQRNG
jgi:phosphoserine aminotransferase